MNAIIKNINIVNEGRIVNGDVIIRNQRIESIGTSLSPEKMQNYREINGEGLYLLPGIIDDQVHFREPGLIHKGTIASESRAAVAGGITSYMEMPNTIPNTLSQDLLEQKYAIAARQSMANYSFFMGINKTNLEEVLKTDTESVCGISDDGLYFQGEDGILANHPEFLEKLFSRSETLIALHSEDETIIKNNETYYKSLFGDNIPFQYHPLIRSEASCVQATTRIMDIAAKFNTRLHILHVSTLKEALLFDSKIPLVQKRITAEACIHHLFFSDKDYKKLGSKLKWNPAVKTESDRKGLLQALLDGHLDIIASDHAPHTILEKAGNYFSALSGGPLVQHALPAMLELFHKGEITLDKIAEKMAHNVAEIYKIKNRGYIREGYFADLVIVNLNTASLVTAKSLYYKCGWSPFEGFKFQGAVVSTFVNGVVAFDRGLFNASTAGQRLQFSKFR